MDEGLYREIILDHYRSPRNRGELPVPPARKLEGFNPLCGDEIILYTPPSEAYGERDMSPDIPPNSTLAFDVELLSFA